METRGSHCNEMSRTNPSEAIERLAMTLNYPRREPLSINELAEKTDLSWATTKKYVQLLETLGRISPKISVNKDGVTSVQLSENFHDIEDEQDIQLVVYLFTHANIKGNPTAPLDLETHEVLKNYEEEIDELSDLGWVKVSDETIQLTPEGVSIAGPAHSRLRNQDIEVRPNHTKSQSTTRPESSGSANILVDDPGQDEPISGTKSNVSETWEDDYSENDFGEGAKVSP